MFNRSVALLRLQVCRVLAIFALPMACAVGTEPEPARGTDTDTEGGSGGAATAGSPGSSGGGAQPPKGGAAAGGNSGAFGGTGGAGGKASGGSAGAAGSGGASGGSGGSNAGAGGGASGGASAGSGGASAGSGGGTGSCDCSQKTVAWMDGVSTSFTTGDCVTADGKTFLYTGAKEQTFAHPDCHPGAQKMTWCAQAGSDYVFTACN